MLQINVVFIQVCTWPWATLVRRIICGTKSLLVIQEGWLWRPVIGHSPSVIFIVVCSRPFHFGRRVHLDIFVSLILSRAVAESNVSSLDADLGKGTFQLQCAIRPGFSFEVVGPRAQVFLFLSMLFFRAIEPRPLGAKLLFLAQNLLVLWVYLVLESRILIHSKILAWPG